MLAVTATPNDTPLTIFLMATRCLEGKAGINAIRITSVDFMSGTVPRYQRHNSILNIMVHNVYMQNQILAQRRTGSI